MIVFFIMIAGSLVAFKIPFVGMVTTIIGILVLVDFLSNTTVIMGYIGDGTSYITITESFPELRIVAIILIFVNVSCTLLGLTKAGF
jgi:hypothetical protein